MTRDFLPLAATAAATLLTAACGSPPTSEEADLDQRGSHPEVLANATGPGADPDPSVIAGTAQQNETGTPGGPASDTGSAQGDTTATR